MESKKLPKDKSKMKQSETSNDKLKKIKSNYFLERIFNNILKKNSLEIVKYNKNIQNRINLSIKDYKDY